MMNLCDLIPNIDEYDVLTWEPSQHLDDYLCPEGIMQRPELAYRYGFNGQEKESQITGAETHTSAEYWMYDTRLGRRWNLDPKPQIFISDYAVMADNPIWFNDILGDKWKDPAKDGARAKEINGALENKKNSYNTAAEKFLKKYDNAVAKGKSEKADKLWSKYELNAECSAEMQKAQNELTAIAEHPTLEFTFTNCIPGSGACYTHMDNDGVINIENTSDATAIHELTHAHQHITGEIELVAGTGGGYYADLHDERAAYRRQYIFDPNSFSNIESKPGLYLKNYKSISLEWVRFARSVTYIKNTDGKIIKTQYGEYLYDQNPWNRIDRSVEEFFDRHPELSRPSPIIK